MHCFQKLFVQIPDRAQLQRQHPRSQRPPPLMSITSVLMLALVAFIPGTVIAAPVGQSIDNLPDPASTFTDGPLLQPMFNKRDVELWRKLRGIGRAPDPEVNERELGGSFGLVNEGFIGAEIPVDDTPLPDGLEAPKPEQKTQEPPVPKTEDAVDEDEDVPFEEYEPKDYMLDFLGALELLNEDGTLDEGLFGLEERNLKDVRERKLLKRALLRR